LNAGNEYGRNNCGAESNDYNNENLIDFHTSSFGIFREYIFSPQAY
jgi:hypothetical protein